MIKYRNEGQIISFKLDDANYNHICDIVVTYFQLSAEEYSVSMCLRKVIATDEGENKYMYEVDTQILSGNKNTIKSNISRVVEFGIKTKYFDKYVKNFSDGIIDRIGHENIMKMVG